MSSEVVIRAEGLGKRYLIRHQAKGERYLALRDVIGNTAKGLFRGTAERARGQARLRNGAAEEFWALRDIDFEVRRGEVLGIIGHNGAGKSTLLKILSRITEPSEGRVMIKGRVASLLEVGTGFHPELTGRENIFLNGAILGMHRGEIKRKFDEIVAFAGVEKFLDTPVKRYSSGMYVRLAFAVAAHLDPEILVIDEVLAVGDADFQRKCLQKLSEVAQGQERTVLFVSHNLGAVEHMCSRALLLSKGKCVADGNVENVIAEYTRGLHHLNLTSLNERKDRRGTGVLRFFSMSLEQKDGSPAAVFLCGSDGVLNIRLENRTDHALTNVVISLGVDNDIGQRVTLLDTELVNANVPSIPTGIHTVRILLPRMSLNPGRYYVTFFTTVSGHVADWITHGAFFDVEAGDYYGSGRSVPPGQGLFMVPVEFIFEDPESGSQGGIRKNVAC